MIKNAKFHLVIHRNMMTLADYHDELGIKLGSRSRFPVQCGLFSFPPPSGIWDDKNHNLCNILNTRLGEQLCLPQSESGLSLDFTVEKNSQNGTNGPLQVTARGKILEQLMSLMSYGVNDSKLKLLLSADLLILKDGQSINANAKDLPTVKFHTELLPQLGSEGHVDHSIYLNSEGAKWVFNVGAVDNIMIRIEGIEKKTTVTNPNSFMELLREKGFGSQLTLQYRGVDDEEESSTIRVHENILIAQSSVIKTMLEEEKFAEGSARVISMADWTKEEVTAFIHYLYFGDLEVLWNNAALAICLYEMSHFYGVKSLEQATKTVLLHMPPGLSNPCDYIRLLGAAVTANDWGMMLLAIDILKLFDNDEQECYGPRFDDQEVFAVERFQMSFKS